MKKILHAACAFVLFALLAAVPCGASDAGGLEMPEEIDDFLSAVPDEVAELLPEGFLDGDGGFGEAVRRASGGDYLINTALRIIGGGLDEAAGTFCTLVGIALVAAVFGSVRQSLFSRGLSDCLLYTSDAADD